jgi:hypothetical protein
MTPERAWHFDAVGSAAWCQLDTNSIPPPPRIERIQSPQRASSPLQQEENLMAHLPLTGRRISVVTLATALAVVALIVAGAGNAADPSEHIYADGNTYTINTAAAVQLDASQGMLDEAAPFYIIGFPVAQGTTGPITLPSGYQPQNNGLPAPIPYHDHIAADVNNPLRRVVELRYSWAYAYSPAFVPLTRVDQLAGAEASGKLDIVAPGATDPYQHWTNTVLVRPIVP